MEYYVQDDRQYVGNSMLWWRKECAGYVCDIREAHVFPSLEAAKKRCSRPTDIPWKKEFIDGIVSHHIDMQHARRGLVFRDDGP